MVHKLKRHIAVIKQTLCVDGVNVVQEFDDHGNHRFIISTCRHTPSAWTGYQYIAVRSNYRGTSEYYGTMLPRLFKIIEGK